MHRYIFAVDPGNVRSAFALLDADTLRPIQSGIAENGELLEAIADHRLRGSTAFVVEMVASYGMAVGKEVFETVFWIGQFYAAAAPFLSRHRVTAWK